MAEGSIRVPIGEGRAYWLSEPGVDLDQALHEARNLPYHLNDRGVKFGPGAIEVGVLDTRVGSVEVTYEVLTAPPFDRLDSLYSSYDEISNLPLSTDDGLELRDHLGERVRISDGSTVYDVVVLRNLAQPGSEVERHHLVLWPNDFEISAEDHVYFGSFEVLDEDDLDDDQYAAFVVQGDEPPTADAETPRRIGLAIIRALESKWPDEREGGEAHTRALLLAQELTGMGAFEATISESGRGQSVYVDARPLTTAMLAVMEALLAQPGVDRAAALMAARDIVNVLDAGPPMPPPPVDVRPGREGIADRVLNHGTPVVRTDFADDLAWNRLVRAVTAPQYIEGEEYVVAVEAVDDPDLAGLTPEALASDWPEDVYGYVMLADAASMKPSDPTVLFVDLAQERGRSFRSAATEVASIIVNLDIANVDFEEFAAYADQQSEDRVYRGSVGEPD